MSLRWKWRVLNGHKISDSLLPMTKQNVLYYTTLYYKYRCDYDKFISSCVHFIMQYRREFAALMIDIQFVAQTLWVFMLYNYCYHLLKGCWYTLPSVYQNTISIKNFIRSWYCIRKVISIVARYTVIKQLVDSRTIEYLVSYQCI